MPREALPIPFVYTVLSAARSFALPYFLYPGIRHLYAIALRLEQEKRIFGELDTVRRGVYAPLLDLNLRTYRLAAQDSRGHRFLHLGSS